MFENTNYGFIPKTTAPEGVDERSHVFTGLFHYCNSDRDEECRGKSEEMFGETVSLTADAKTRNRFIGRAVVAQNGCTGRPDAYMKAAGIDFPEQFKDAGDLYEVIGSRFYDSMRGTWDEADAQRKEYERGAKEFGEQLATILPAAILGDGTLDADTMEKATRYGRAEEILGLIGRTRAAIERIRSLQRGGRSAEEYERAVEATAGKLERDWDNAEIMMVAQTGMNRKKPSREEFLQQARAEEGGRYTISRDNIVNIIDSLRDEEGNLDERSLALMVLALDADAQGQQTIDSKFGRNFVEGARSWFLETVDFVNRGNAKSGTIWQGPDMMPIYLSPEDAADFRKAYSADVEKFKGALRMIEDKRLSASDKASLLAGVMTELGTIAGESAPAIVAGMATGGFGGFALSTAAMAPSSMNRNIAQAYYEGKPNAELDGAITGFFDAAAEAGFGTAIRTVPLMGKFLDKMAVSGLGSKAIATTFSKMQGNAFARFVGDRVIGESVGELLGEELLSQSGSYLAINALRSLGVDMDAPEWAPFSTALQNFTDYRQSMATVAFCASLGLLGMKADIQASRQFAKRTDAMLAAGVTQQSAAKLAKRAEDTEAKIAGLYSTEGKSAATDAKVEELWETEYMTYARDVYRSEVWEADPVELRDRLAKEKQLYMSDIEAVASAREGVLQASLRESGVLSTEQTMDGKYRVTVVDNAQVQKDAEGWEDGKAPADYVAPVKEVEMTEEQLAAWAQYSLGNEGLRRMKEIRSAALALDMAGKVDESERGYAKMLPLTNAAAPVAVELGKAHGMMSLPVLRALAEAAKKEGANGVQVLPGVSNTVTARTAVSLEQRLDIAEALGELTPEAAQAAREGGGGVGAGAMRLPATEGAASRIVYNPGHTKSGSIAEDAVEAMLTDRLKKDGGMTTDGVLTDKGQAWLESMLAEMQAVNKAVKAATGEELMQGIDTAEADLQTVTEYFSHFAKSNFYRRADSYGISPEARRHVEFMDSALMQGQFLEMLDRGFMQWVGTKEGQDWEKSGGTLASLLREAGHELGSLYNNSRVTAENVAAVEQARAYMHEAREVTLADVERTLKMVAEEQEERDNPVEVSHVVPAEDSITGEEIPDDGGEASAPYTEDGELIAPVGTEVQVDVDTKGKGLVNGQYAVLPDGSMMGVASVDDISLCPDVPQFKTRAVAGGREKAKEDGTTHELSGGFRKDAPPITVWRRKDGALQVITGRHRLAHARKCGESFISVRVYDEDAVHDAAWAKLYDVEMNILDRTAGAQDVAYFFRNTNMSLEEAEARGLMPRRKDGEQTATGTVGIAVARNACEEVYTRFINGAVSERNAYFIATLGVDVPEQELALKLLTDKKPKSLEYVKSYVATARQQRELSDAPALFDLFGNDESWAQEADKLARYVESLRRQLHAQMNILQGAGSLKRKGEAAGKLGVKVKTPKDLPRTLAQMTLLDEALERMDTDLGLGALAAAWDGKSVPDMKGTGLMEYGAALAKRADVGSQALESVGGRSRTEVRAALVERARKVQPFKDAKRARTDVPFNKNEVLAILNNTSLSDEESRAAKVELAKKNFEAVYALAEECKDEFCGILTRVAHQLGLQSYLRTSLKGIKRASEKTAEDYFCDAGQCLDINGGTFVLNDDTDPQEIIDAIRDAGMEIVCVKNGYLKHDPSGYQDMKLNLRMPNGFVGELIIIEQNMSDVKAGDGHKIYEALREMAPIISSSKDPEQVESLKRMTDALNALSTALYQEMPEEEVGRLYNEAKEVYSRELAYSQKSASVAGANSIPLSGKEAGQDVSTNTTSSPGSSSGLYHFPSLACAQTASLSASNKKLTNSGADARNLETASDISDTAIPQLDEKSKNFLQDFGSFALNVEMEDIKARAMAEGTFMKAPNGQPTNLTERQWLQVRTKAFKEWFGDWENAPENASKVVDENGEPKVVYHNSGKRRKILSREYSRKSMDIESVCFAPKSDPYKEYGPYEHAVFLKVVNPADFKTAYQKHGIQLGATDDAGVKIREWLQDCGYDGVIEEEDGVPFEYKVFDSTQIKSATENRGTFDAGNADITFSVAEQRKMDARYMDAVKRGDMEEAGRMVREYAAKRGYIPHDKDYWMSHRPMAEGAEKKTPEQRMEDGDALSILDLAKGYWNVPKDFFEHPEWYDTQPGSREAARQVKKAIEQTRAWLAGERTTEPGFRCYRAVPKDVKEERPRNGDWVTPSREYAEEHIQHSLDGKGKIQYFYAKVSELYFNGDSVMEFGYHDGNDYAYRNTKNNRKLLAPVTYDYDGNIVPLSKRFNSRALEVSFSITTAERQQWEGEAGKVMDSLEQSDRLLHMMKMPAVLRALGCRHEYLDIQAQTILKAWERGVPDKKSGHQHNLTRAQILRLPVGIADPVMVVEGDPKKGKSLVVLTDMKVGEKHVMAAIHLDREMGRGTRVDLVASSYERDSVALFNRAKLLYLDTKRIPDWLATERFIMSASGGLRNPDGGIIPAKKDDVNGNFVDTNRVPAWHPIADAILAGEGGLRNPDGSIILTKADIVKQESGISMSLEINRAAQDAVQPYGKEAVMAAMVRRIEQAGRMWTTTFAGRDPMEARDAAAEQMGQLMSMAAGIYRAMPDGYRVRLEPMLRRGQVFANMLESGKLRSFGKISKEQRAALEEEIEAQMDTPEVWTAIHGAVHDAVSVKQEVAGGGKKAFTEAYKAEREAIVRDIAGKNLVQLYTDMAQEAAEQMRRYLRDQEVKKIAALVERFTPKVGKNGKMQRGKLEASMYRKLARLVQMMQADAKVREESIAALQGKIAEAEKAGDEEKCDALTAEQMEWSTYGAIRSQSLDAVRKARAELLALLATGRARWEAKLADEKAAVDYLCDVAVRAMGEADDSALANMKDEDAKASVWQKLKRLPAYAQSIGQLLYGLAGVPGLGELADESSRAITRGHLALASRENALQEAMNKKLEELGFKTDAEKADFMKLLKEKVDTGIVPLPDSVTHRVKLSLDEARRWLDMSKEERDAERERLKKQEDDTQRKVGNVPQEEDIALMRDELKKAESGNRERKWVTVEREVEAAAKKKPLCITRDEALNLLLLCEQERYRTGNAAAHGYTDEVFGKLRDFVGEKALSFGYWMRDYLSGTGLAEVFEAREGVPFPAEENYWPGEFDQSGRVNENVNALDPASGQCSTRYSMLMLRVNHNLNFDLSIGATNAFMGAIAMQNNYICMGALTAQWRRLLGNQRFARSLRQKVGEGTFRAIKDGINLLDGQGVAEAYSQKALSGIIGQFQSAHAPAVLAGATTTLIKQLSAVMHASCYPGVSPLRLMGQLISDRLGGGKMTYGKMMKEQVFKERCGDKAVWEEMLTLGANVKWSRLAAWSRTGMNWLERADVAANCASMTALYNIMWKKLEHAVGLTDEECHARCMEAVERTMDLAAQPMRRSQKSLAAAVGGGNVWNALNFYMASEVMNKVGMVLASYKRGGGGWRGFKGAWKFLVTMSCAEQLMCMVIDLLRGNGPDADDDESWAMWLACNAATGISGAGLISGIPVLGGLVQHATGGYVKTAAISDALGLDLVKNGKKIYRMSTNKKHYSTAEWAIQLLNASRALAGGLGTLAGGANSCIQFVSSSTSLLQSVNAVGNFMRPFLQRVAEAEKPKKKRRK